MDNSNIVDFCVRLSKYMIFSGANLERVQIAIARISNTYELKDVSMLLLSTFISLGARMPDGTYISRQTAIPTADNNLQRLKQLNRLTYTIAETKPDIKELNGMLDKALKVESYPQWLVNIAQIAGMSCVCMMFGGGPGEVFCTALIVAVLQQVMRIMARPRIDQVIVNAVLMFIATGLACLIESDYSVNVPVIVITAIIMILPGIPLVNASRNLLCGNESNGVLQLLRINIETMALAAGIVLAMTVFGWEGTIQETVVYGPSHPGLLIPLSFAVSLFTGVTFRIAPKDLLLAGMGGAISRVVLIFLTSFMNRPLIYTFIAAMVAALYAEFLATSRKDPSTYFVYPAILPMIPGGAFYYMIMGVYGADRAMFSSYLMECTLTLVGMSIGFVVSSIVAHYMRRMRHVHIEWYEI